MRYSLLTGLFTLAFILGALPSIAQDEPEEIDCKKPRGHLETITCVGRSARESEQEMQAAYQKLQQKLQQQPQKYLPKDYRQKRLNALIKSQQAWLNYRTAQCQWIESEFEGGSLQPIASIYCEMELNQQRTADLSKSLRSIDL